MFKLLIVSLLQVSFAAAPSLPYSPSLDLTSMNPKANACENFYQYACGGWIAKNPIPADQGSWNVYKKLTLDNETFIRDLLEEGAHATAKRTEIQKKIGDYYHACMDEAAVEKADLKPLQSRLDAIALLQTKADVARFISEAHASGLGSGTLFAISSDQDFANAESVITFAGRGELGLPDRDYYTKNDKKSVEIRARYKDYLRSTFRLLGDSDKLAGQEAEQVYGLENNLAKAMLTQVELRNPRNLFHKMTLSQFQASVPAFAWTAYFKTLGLEKQTEINVTEPKYFQAVQKLLTARPIEEWRAFLRWSMIHDSAQFLSSRFVTAEFAFYGKYLSGAEQLRPRWRRCATWTDSDLGEALGQVFVAKTFTADTKARTLNMTKEIEAILETELHTLAWMGEATRQKALEKIHTLTNKIGYPDQWRDYSTLVIKPDDFSGNILRAAQFERSRTLRKIGKPLERQEWSLSPPTVNAGYSPQLNDLTFPAGVLQPPLFDAKMDDAPNYGNTGATIGHELTHAFDDEGRMYDAHGNLKDWWTKKDRQEFERRAQCLVKQYSGYVAVEQLHVNGKLTNGEDIADLGGTVLAYAAWKGAVKARELKSVDGFSPDQRFFIGMAQWACGDAKSETKREWAITNPHSPLEYRVNGVLANMPEFAQAFTCSKGQPMVHDKICKIW